MRAAARIIRRRRLLHGELTIERGCSNRAAARFAFGEREGGGIVTA